MDSTKFFKIIGLLSIIVLNGIMFNDAFAYIDPGSGSLVIQMVIGALVGVGITVKVYWLRIKIKLSSLSKNDD